MSVQRALLAATAASAFLGAQAQTWENSEEDGNVRIAVHDDTFNWGTTLPSEALDQIKDHCSSVGCHSGDKLYVPTGIVDGWTLHDRDLELSIQASFSVNDEIGSLEELVEIAKEVVKGNHELRHYTYNDSGRWCDAPSNVGCVRKLHCSDLGEQERLMLTNVSIAGQHDDPVAEQFYTTNQIHIRVDEGTGPDLLIMISVAESDSGAPWCENIGAAGAAIAGGLSANPMVGSAFSLASLICGNL